MSRRITRTGKDVCQLCEFITAKPTSLQPPRAPRIKSSLQTRHARSRLSLQHIRPLSNKSQQKIKQPTGSTSSRQAQAPNNHHATQSELEAALVNARSATDTLLTLDRIPQEDEVLHALQECETLANLIVSHDSHDAISNNGALSSLLQIDATPTSKPAAATAILPKTPPTHQAVVDDLSNLAYTLITHPPVFISPDILSLYTSIQTSLQRPQTLPEIFHLYATKPLPKEGTSSPIQYIDQNPNKAASAIPIKTADLALTSAIEAKQLPTAMDLIETSYSTPAFRRAKFIRKGLLPVTGLAAAPVAAYTIAAQLAAMQNTMDTQLATNVAFTGMIAYVGFTATIGIVALTTANDQMQRVTWAQGLPLRERWVREEERAACDRVALAWGFREEWKRGDEEGEDWEALREWVANRGMILDAAELLDGMD